MDSSSQDQQSVPMRHAFEGVHAKGLTTEERVSVLRWLIETFSKGWNGNAPGFQPYGQYRTDDEYDVMYGLNVPNNVRTLQIVRLTLKSLEERIALYVSDKGVLLHERYGRRPGGDKWCQLDVCTDEQVQEWMDDPLALLDALRVFGNELTRAKVRAEANLVKIEQAQRAFSRLA